MFCSDQMNRCILVMLVLSIAFDPIVTILLFSFLEHSLCISKSALSLLRSYVSGHLQCVQIGGITSEFADLICGVPQGSV